MPNMTTPTITTRELRQLANRSERWCVSIYLPILHAGAEVKQNSIRLRNLVSAADRELELLGVGADDRGDMLTLASATVSDPEVWAQPGRGLGMLITPSETTIHHLTEIPPELAVVADHFHLGPMLAEIGRDDDFFVLALSRHDVRLLRGNRHGLLDVTPESLPRRLDEVLRYDDREAQLHTHGAASVGGGTVAAAFHGQGLGRDRADVDLRRFLTAVERGVHSALGSSTSPVVLAGVDDIVAQYRRVTDVKGVVRESISGNPDHLTPDQLHERAWPVVRPTFDAVDVREADSIASRHESTIRTLPEAALAAHEGRVRSMFVPLNVHSWAAIDLDERTIDVHPDRRPADRDLFDVAAMETVRTGGTVHLVDASDVPGDGAVAAALRG